MDVELVPWETAKIGIYKDVLKYRDIHIRFGTAAHEIGHVLWFCTYSFVTL